MPVTNSEAGTRIDQVADGIFRICTPLAAVPGGFSFNQYLIVDDAPLLFHTGPRRLFPLVREAIDHVMPVARLRYVALSHVEADECGSLNDFLTAAPDAVPVCGQIAAMVSVSDLADREPKALANGEVLSLGQRAVQWLDTPHVPHGWEAGLLFERTSRTLFCGDLFTEGGAEHPATSSDDILESSERFRAPLDYYSHTRNGPAILARLAETRPAMLARMHGSAWQGDGAAMLLRLAEALDRPSD